MLRLNTNVYRELRWVGHLLNVADCGKNSGLRSQLLLHVKCARLNTYTFVGDGKHVEGEHDEARD